MLSNLLSINEFGGGSTNSPRAVALLEALDKGIGYGDAGAATRDFIQNMRYAKIQHLMGERGRFSNEEEKAMRDRLTDVQTEIDTEISELYSNAQDLGGGIWRLADGTEVVRREHSANLRAQKSKAAGLDILRNYFNMGLTERNLRAVYGNEAAHMLDVLSPSAGVE